MQKRSVNEVVANNSTYTPAPIVRVTQEQYSALANHIFDYSAGTFGKPLSILWDEEEDIVAKFEGYNEGDGVVTLGISVDTFDEEGNRLSNDFDEAIFLAHLRELNDYSKIC